MFINQKLKNKQFQLSPSVKHFQENNCFLTNTVNTNLLFSLCRSLMHGNNDKFLAVHLSDKGDDLPLCIFFLYSHYKARRNNMIFWCLLRQKSPHYLTCLMLYTCRHLCPYRCTKCAGFVSLLQQK